MTESRRAQARFFADVQNRGVGLSRCPMPGSPRFDSVAGQARPRESFFFFSDAEAVRDTDSVDAGAKGKKTRRSSTRPQRVSVTVTVTDTPLTARSIDFRFATLAAQPVRSLPLPLATHHSNYPFSHHSTNLPSEHLHLAAGPTVSCSASLLRNARYRFCLFHPPPVQPSPASEPPSSESGDASSTPAQSASDQFLHLPPPTSSFSQLARFRLPASYTPQRQRHQQQ